MSKTLSFLLLVSLCVRMTAPVHGLEHGEGTRIAFVMTSTTTSSLFTIQSDGQDLREAAECLDLCRDPVWAANGHQIGLIDGNALVIAEVNTARLDRFPVDLGTYDYAVQPDWTADLLQVIHPARVNMTGVLRLTDLARHTTVDLPNIPDASAFPVWIDGGKAILFSAGGRVFYYDMKQRLATALTPPGQAFDLPVPSPDNTRILLRRIDATDPGLALLDRATGDIRTILKGIVDSPRWSPDGTAIALNIWSDGVVSLNLVSLEIGTQITLAENAALGSAPAWSPDSGHIAYSGIDPAQPQYNALFVVAVSGKIPPQRLVERISRAGSTLNGVDWQPDGEET